MKKIQIALGILVAGTGVMASAFTTKFLNPITTGWYTYTGNTYTATLFSSIFVVLGVPLTTTGYVGDIKNLPICANFSVRICAAFYTTSSSFPHDYVTGKKEN